MTDLEALRAFARKLMLNWPEGGVDGGELQDVAEEFGLLAGQRVTQSCGDNCACAEYDLLDEAHPQTCYKRTARLIGDGA